MSTNDFKWYIHDTTKNETLRAIQLAAVHNVALLVFVCKPGCAICEAAWKAVNTSAMLKYLQTKKILGLKVCDSASHYMALASGCKTFKNLLDGDKTNTNNAFLMIFKPRYVIGVDELSLTVKKVGGDVDTWFGGTTSKYTAKMNANNVMAWLDQITALDEYLSKFPSLQSPDKPVPEKNALPELTTDNPNPTDAQEEHLVSFNVNFFIGMPAGTDKDELRKQADKLKEALFDLIAGALDLTNSKTTHTVVINNVK